MTVLTVTLNAALDVTYEVARLRAGEVHRVTDVAQRAGGKGINVARVLHRLGTATRVTGLAGGDVGRAIRRDLAAAGIPCDLDEVAGAARRTVTVVGRDSGDSTLLNEPGPVIAPAEWSRFLARWPARVRGASVVVLSGSLPRGVPDDAYRTLAERTAAPVILDADGAALAHGVAGRPDIAKPNAEELRRATGAEDPRAGAEALRAAGADTVVVSLGAAGLLACTPDGCWRAAAPERLDGNPVGAGDALVAALARGLLGGASWPSRLADAVALSAAAVASPLAGDVDAGTYARLAPLVSATALKTARP